MPHATQAGVAQRASTHTGSRAAGSVLLPSAIKPEDIQATMANGILKVSVPKPAHAGQEPKKIDIKAAA